MGTPRKRWSEKTGYGILRAQCKDCFDAGLTPNRSINLCAVCAERSARRQAQMARLSAFLDGLDPSGDRSSAGLRGGSQHPAPANAGAHAGGSELEP